MPRTDAYETEVLAAFESGALKSGASKSEFAKFKSAARATATKERRVNIRLSRGDLQRIQPKNRSYPGAARAGGGVGRANWPTILRQM